MPHGSKRYIWQHGAQCRGVDGCLTNLASGGRRGESRARPGAASRVAAWEFLVWLPSVHRFEGSAVGRPKAAQRPT
jgi:hypothetical protein